MSSDAADSGVTQGSPDWDRLELNVRRMLDEHDALQRRLKAAERRARQLEKALAKVSEGQLDPVALEGRARALETENQDLHQRIDAARATVERIASRFHFLEEES